MGLSLIDGLIISTIEDGKVESNHSLLQEFYSLDDEIHNIGCDRTDKFYKTFNELYDKFKPKSKAYKEQMEIARKEYKSHDLSLYFMRIKALSLLKVLQII